ncbi:MAG: hypothetical protein HRT35_11880 [Algicola sp.]|nr:hypothetical protein [Algicola sp.]
MGAASVGLTHYRFDNKIYQKGSGRLFLVLEQKLEELGPLSLTHQAYLSFIIDKDGQIASFDELAQLEGKQVNNNTVSKHIGKIKQRVGCDIENVPRQGYKLDSAPAKIDIKRFESKSKKQRLSSVFIVSVILFVLSLSIWLVNPVAQGQSIIPSQNQRTLDHSTEQHDLFSPDGRLQAFEQKNPQQQLTNLWINNLHTGEKLALTAAKTGVEDKLGGFSKDGLRLLFSRSITKEKKNNKQRSTCSINEIVFTQFNPIKYSEKQLFECQSEDKTIKGKYGRTTNIWLKPLFNTHPP